MYEASSDYSKNWDTMMQIIEDRNLDAEDVLEYLVSWHGMQLLDQSFIENLINYEL